ncbi:MAG: hypothetical protein R3195_00950 [Gemmatimonadota bacterium]|nr:hypothetical protein [Gemmatimonadota bacterium]
MTPDLDVVLRSFEKPDEVREVELSAGDLFHIPPEPHDSWVVGDEPYVSLHFLGADNYGG